MEAANNHGICSLLNLLHYASSTNDNGLQVWFYAIFPISGLATPWGTKGEEGSDIEGSMDANGNDFRCEA